MHIPRFYEKPDSPTSSVWRTAKDVAVVLLLVATMVALRANAPVNTHNYAQFWQIRVSIDHLNGGSLVLGKIDSLGTPARKGPLYAWLLTAAMYLTGADNDFIFRIPTILASAGLAVLIYFLGRRWYGRWAGLAAACLWITCLHMSKLMYLATTDMLLAWWIGLCIYCADRLTFHPAERRRWWWAAVFWLAMIAAALTKGWGVVNLAVLGGFLALAGGLGPGFAALRKARGVDKCVLAGRLVLRRWWAVIRAVRLGWGLLAMAAVFGTLFTTMLLIGGKAFRETLYFEVWQRLTGQGEHAPGGTSMLAIFHLYYNTLPASVFAGCALFLVPIRRWLGRHSPIALPLWWIITVLLAFGIPSGFRPDYLLPCYAAVALLAGWAVGELSRPVRYNDRIAKHFRRICQAVPFVLAVGLILVPPIYLFHWLLPEGLAKSLSLPPRFRPGVWYILSALPAIGVGVAWLAARAVRRRRLGLTIAATCAGMIGILFLNANFFTRQARTGDGDAMVCFGRDCRPVIGQDDFLLYGATKLGAEVYLGRFGTELVGLPAEMADRLNAAPQRWLITCDIGLLYLGAYEPDPQGSVTIKKDGRKYRFRPCPEDVGRLAVRSIAPILFENWGSIYLIELGRPIRPRSKPFETGYISDEVH